MPANSYNISRLIAELGLKNVTELPLAERIQPVISLDSMRGQVPLHQGPVGLFGGLTATSLLEYSLFELISLDPGGLVICFMYHSLLSGFISVRTDVLAWGAFGPTPHPAQQFGNTPVASLVNSGTTLVVPSVDEPIIGQLEAGSYAPLYVPRGSRAVFQTLSINTAFNFGIQVMGITATQPEIEPVP